MKPLPPSPHLKPKLLTLLQTPTTPQSFTQIYSLLLTSGLVTHHPIALKLTHNLALSFTHTPSFAYQTLKQFHHPPFLFNTLISGFAQSKHPHSSLTIFKHMLFDCIHPDKYTFPIILKSCAKFKGAREAKQLHGVITKMGFASDVFVLNAMVSVYGVCGEFGNAREVFDGMGVRDVVSWTELISVYVKGGMFGTALGLFGTMDVELNFATVVSVLVACGRMGEVKIGRKLHGLVLKKEEMGVIVGNALVDMYVKCERLEEARMVFEEMPEKDIVSWTCIISGLVQCKQAKNAIEVFHEMQESGVEADKVVLSSVLSACASMGALELGRWVHEYIVRKGIEWDVHIGTAMIDMYAKCGCLETAVCTFREIPIKNIFSWNALLGGLALHGHGAEVLDYFDQLIRTGIIPNEVTFIAILSACSHSGLVDEGRHFFSSMTKCYSITPRIEHYGCMVDLLCRAGLLDEANKLVKSMPMKPDVLIWGAMLSAWKAHKNAEFSQVILNKFVQLKSSSDSGVYVLLSNIFAMKDRWRDATMVRRLMKEKGIKKEPGSSAIQENGKIHEFLVGESTTHPEEENIWMMSNILARQIQLDA